MPIQDRWSSGTKAPIYGGISFQRMPKHYYLEELRSSGITALSLFPELDNVASEASRGY